MITNRKLGHLQVSAGNEDDVMAFIAAAIAAGKKAYGVPLNLTKYVVSKKNDKLRQTILAAGLVNADGVSMVWLARRLGYRDVGRVTGVELAERLIQESAGRKWSIFILGAAPEVVFQAVKNLRARYPAADIVGFHHGFFKENEIPGIIKQINRLRPGILFLGLGMPQKEYFIHDHFQQLQIHFCLPVGGAIDVWAGAKKRTPPLVQKVGLEWFYRSFYDFSKAGNILRYGLVFLKDLLLIKK